MSANTGIILGNICIYAYIHMLHVASLSTKLVKSELLPGRCRNLPSFCKEIEYISSGQSKTSVCSKVNEVGECISLTGKKSK